MVVPCVGGPPGYADHEVVLQCAADQLGVGDDRKGGGVTLGGDRNVGPPSCEGLREEGSHAAEMALGGILLCVVWGTE